MTIKDTFELFIKILNGNGTRWYLAETGTFLSRDVVEGEPAYQYVRGNVVNRVDPSGKYPCDNSPTPTPPSPPPGEPSLDEIRINHKDVDGAGGKVTTYLNSEKGALIATRVAIGEASGKDRSYVLWIIRKRMEMYSLTANAVVLAPGQFDTMKRVKNSDENNNPFYPEYIATYQTEKLRQALINNQPFDDFDKCTVFSEMLHVCNNTNVQQDFKNVYAEAVTILNSPVSLVPVDLKGYDGFLAKDYPTGVIMRPGGLPSKRMPNIIDGNVYNDKDTTDNDAGY